jgi:hypothetical protein
MLVALFILSLKTYRSSQDPFVRALSLGFAAVLIGVTFNGFLSTIFEIRTLAFYLWMYGGFICVLGKRNEVVRT